MKLKLFFIVFTIFQTTFAQELHLTEGKTTHKNNDRRLYRINEVPTDSLSVYLGKLEIRGNLQNEVETFDKFYKKAKLLGANTYIYNVKMDLDSRPIPTDHREIVFYYTPRPDIGEENTFRVFNSTKEMKIIINGKREKISPQTYFSRPIEQDSYISVGKFLGSRVNLVYKKGQPQQNFQVLSTKFGSDNSGNTGGLIIKSGDIILLEKSYSDFLTLFYERLE